MTELLNPSEYYRFIFVILAAICNALMDSVENEHFVVTKFRYLNRKFWYKRISWQYAKVVFKYKIDSWHLSKSLMLIFLGIFCCFPAHINSFINFAIFGICWLATFNLFYNHVFKK